MQAAAQLFVSEGYPEASGSSHHITVGRHESDVGDSLTEGDGPPLGMLDGFQYGTQEYEIGTGDMVIVVSTVSTGLFRGAADLVSTLQQKPAGEVVATVHKAIRKLQGEDTQEITVLFMRKH